MYGGAAARGIIQEGNNLECNIKRAGAWFQVFKFSLLQTVSFFCARIDIGAHETPELLASAHNASYYLLKYELTERLLV